MVRPTTLIAVSSSIAYAGTGRPAAQTSAAAIRVVCHRLVVQVREHCEVDEAQRWVVTGGDWAPRDKPLPDL